MIPLKELVIVAALIGSGWACVRVFKVYRFYVCSDASAMVTEDFGDAWNVRFLGYKPGKGPARDVREESQWE